MKTLSPPNRTLDDGLRFLPRPDMDYGDAFQSLASVECTMRREGTTEELLLRRAQALLALGNYLRAATDAETVARGNPGCIEAHFVKGQANLAMAAVKMGLARPGLGSAMPRSSLPTTSKLLGVARQCFTDVLARNPDDSQAARALAAAERLMTANSAHSTR